jgi:hypothetical protein
VWIGLSSVLFAAMLIISIARTVARGEWKYWQRILGLIALTASGVVLILIGLPEMGTDARDAGWTMHNGRKYALLVQNIPTPPNVTLRLSIFECDEGLINCARVQVDDVEYRTSDHIPALDLIRITNDGPWVITQSNTTSSSLSTYKPQ